MPCLYNGVLYNGACYNDTRYNDIRYHDIPTTGSRHNRARL